MWKMQRLKRVFIYLKDAYPMIAFVIFYLLSFRILEKVNRIKYYNIDIELDEKIPFIPAFVIPYCFWFVYIIVIPVYLYIKDINSYKRASLYYVFGCTLFIVISALYPNILYLRPSSIDNTGICNKIVLAIWKSDTPTNVFPSIHVYNSVVATVAMLKSNTKLGKNRYIRVSCIVTAILISLSTIFIKQHSLMDVTGGLVLAIIGYRLVYNKVPIIQWLRKNRPYITINN